MNKMQTYLALVNVIADDGRCYQDFIGLYATLDLAKAKIQRYCANNSVTELLKWLDDGDISRTTGIDFPKAQVRAYFWIGLTPIESE
jgi:hypothetical protein